MFRKLLEVRIEEDEGVCVCSEFRPLKGMNLYQQALITLMFERDRREVSKWIKAIRILGIADVCSSQRPELAMSMFERTMDDLHDTCGDFLRHLGGNLNFNPAGA